MSPKMMTQDTSTFCGMDRQHKKARKNKNQKNLSIPSPNTIAQQHIVKVDFLEQLSTEQIVSEIIQLSTPQVIIWYIGCDGLRMSGAQFYRDFLINPILKQKEDASFWLIDLTGWNGLKNRKYSFQSASSCCDAIEKFSCSKIACIKSSQIFQKIQTLDDISLINYLRKAIRKSFVHKASINFPNKNILVRELFSNNCPVMIEWYNIDVAKAYSTLQYLEGCFLVEEIFMQLIARHSTNEFQIVFALPNDELKYYKDSFDSFQNDIGFLISKRCEALNIKKVELHIKFLAFQYGTELQHRPYNTPGKRLKKNNLTHDLVVGNTKEPSKNTFSGDTYATTP